MNQSSSVVAALVLGAAILGGSYMITRALDQGTRELQGVHDSLAGVQEALDSATGRRAAAARPSRPDPSGDYEVAIDGAPVRGPADAEVTIVEFGDFQCPFCGRVNGTLHQVRQEYGDDVRLVFKHLPLRIHPQAPAAHAAAEAAHRQGKFWEMHDKIFENQRDLSEERFVAYAQELGLDVERFKRDLASEAVKQRVESDSQEAAKLGVSGTPAFFINGKYLSGAQPFEAFKQRIDAELGRG
jgi:protein-disulfide isomerase